MKAQMNIFDMNDSKERVYERRLHERRLHERGLHERGLHEGRFHKGRFHMLHHFKSKIVACMMTVCLIVICAISYHSISTSAHTGEGDINFKYYTSITVAYGDTLWDIADDYIDYKEYENKVQYISEVRSINHLDEDCQIKAGQMIIVPYYSTEFVK